MEIPGVGTIPGLSWREKGLTISWSSKWKSRRSFLPGTSNSLKRCDEKNRGKLRSDILITPKVDLVEPIACPKVRGRPAGY